MVDFVHTNEFVSSVNSLVYTAPLVGILYNAEGSALETASYTEGTDVDGGTQINVASHPFGNPGDFSDVQFTAAGTLDSALTAGTTYVARVIDANRISVANSIQEARASTFITLGDDGTGVTTIDEVAPSRVSGIEYVVKKEVANVNGYQRQIIDLAGSFDLSELREELADSTIDFAANSDGAIITTGFALVRSGSDVHGSTAGFLVGVSNFIGGVSINADSIQGFPLELNTLNNLFSLVGA